MTRMLCGALLLFASVTVAQQQRFPPYSPPPYVTPPPAPSEAQNPGQQMPPEMAAPQTPTSAGIARQIQQKLDTEPILKAANLRVAVDDSSVTLTGVVDNEQEHQIALAIAASYAGKRNIVDHIKIRS